MTVPQSIKDGLIIGIAQGVVLVAMLLVLTLLFGNQQALSAKYARAQACELAVPISAQGRDPIVVSKCFTDAGVPAPVFANP